MSFRRTGGQEFRPLGHGVTVSGPAESPSMHARHIVTLLVVAILLVALPAAAQPPLSLAEAIARARAHNPDVGSATATAQESAERVRQARSGYFPRIDFAESWQRGNHP